MPIEIEHDAPGDPETLARQLQARGLHTMQVSVEPVDNAVHWHAFDAEFHILEGDLTFTDASSGQRHNCAAGSVVRVPARCLHAEYSASGYRVVLGTSVPADAFGDPVDRPASTLD